MVDPHEILGVKQGVDEYKLRKRYKKVCKMYHPDKHDGDASSVAIFHLIQKSYETIKKSQEKIELPMIKNEPNTVRKNDRSDRIDKKDDAKNHNRDNSTQMNTSRSESTIEGTNITENDIRVLSQRLNDPWFQPSFSLSEFFGDVQVPKKKK